MAWIIDYQQVLSQMRGLGLRCAYYNSGSFAFGKEVESQMQIVGWVGMNDPTIRPDLPATLVNIAQPYADNLVKRFISFWPAYIDGPAWVLPKSHWHFELEHGHQSWLPDAIQEIGIDPGLLESRNNAAAIEFAADEQNLLQTFISQLLKNLSASDFAILFPRHPHLVTLHHHQQIWWQTHNTALAVRLSKPTWNDQLENVISPEK